MMHDKSLIVRKPLLNSKQQVIGYELSWLQQNTKPVEMQELNALIEFVADQFIDPEHGWLLPDNLLFLEIVPALFQAPALKLLPPKNIVLTLRRSHFLAAATLSATKKLRAQGYGICLRTVEIGKEGGVEITQPDQTVLELISHIEVCGSAAFIRAETAMLAALKQYPINIVACQVQTQEDYDACAALGIDAFSGKLHLTPSHEPASQHHPVNAAQAVILQLMELVRKQSDLTTLETVMQRDGKLSYQLFHYINSDRFGMRPAIHSLTHAVQLLGYRSLYRWLSVLLASTNSNGYSPVLMEAAMIRGRFVELSGIDNLSKNDAEYLFVTGLFSLLDRLLGVSMECVLTAVDLPELISQALLNRRGTYGTYLSLVEACELASAGADSIAESLQISIADVNQTHISALIWAKNVTAAVSSKGG